MSTSADPGPDGRFAMTAQRLDDPEVTALIDEVQAEYVVRYGGPDATPIDPADFEPPGGVFLLGRLDGTAVACGGWRTHDATTAEIKRIFVTAGTRRRGLAGRILTELERTAAAAGMVRMILETGTAQPEALRLYEGRGYRPVPGFGYYKDAPLAVTLGRVITDLR